MGAFFRRGLYPILLRISNCVFSPSFMLLSQFARFLPIMSLINPTRHVQIYLKIYLSEIGHSVLKFSRIFWRKPLQGTLKLCLKLRPNFLRFLFYMGLTAMTSARLSTFYPLGRMIKFPPGFYSFFAGLQEGMTA